MKVSHLFYLLLLLFFCAINLSDAIKQCSGGSIDALADGCTSITDTLYITGDVSEDKIASKLALVHNITGGLCINKTSIKDFYFLRRIRTISNENGYAIIFSENKELYRFRTPDNMTLKGSRKAVYFENDNFLRVAGKRSHENSLGDFARLEVAAKGPNGTLNDWYEVHDTHPITTTRKPFLWMVLLLLGCFLFLAVDVYLFFFSKKLFAKIYKGRKRKLDSVSSKDTTLDQASRSTKPADTAITMDNQMTSTEQKDPSTDIPSTPGKPSGKKAAKGSKKPLNSSPKTKGKEKNQ